MTWSHDALGHDLVKHLRNDERRMVWEDMQMGPAGSARPDVYVIDKSYSKFSPRSYEIKVSRSDFLSDVTHGKWQKYLEFSACVIFAVPAGLIKKDEIPNGCGLIVRHNEVWRMAKRPTLNRVESLSHHAWMKMLISGVERTQREQIKARPPANEYITNHKLRQKYGDEIARLVSTAMRTPEKLKQQIKKDEERLAAIRDENSEIYRNAVRSIQHEASVLNWEQGKLARALGLPSGSTITNLIEAVKKAQDRFNSDNQMTELMRSLEGVKRNLDKAIDVLPRGDR